MKYKFQGQVKDNKLKLDQKGLFLNELKKMNNKRVFLTLEIVRKFRSNQQNRYYFGCVIPLLADEFGYSNMETHEALKFQFLRIQTEGKPDTVKSTASLNTVEFESYLTAIREWAYSQWEVIIPLPNEHNISEFYEICEY